MAWLRRHQVPLFQGGGTWWRHYFEYDKVLVPAAVKPEPVDLSPEEARELLRVSKTYFLRHFSRRFEGPTDFWYVACDSYELDQLPKKTRSTIRGAYRGCSVESLDPAWLAAHGYDCYRAAFARYKNSNAESRETFQEKCLNCLDGPFHFWGVFVGGALAAFAKCVLEGDSVTMSALKIDPLYLRARPAYAVMDTVLRAYVTNGQKQLNNGFRSLSHDTNMQGFLEQFGFRKVYCDLQIVYRPWMASLVAALYSVRPLIRAAPGWAVTSSLNTLVRQEQIRRSFLARSGVSPSAFVQLP